MPTNSREYMNKYYKENKKKFYDPDNKKYCELCKVSIQSNKFKRHIRTLKHQRLLELFQNNNKNIAL